MAVSIRLTEGGQGFLEGFSSKGSCKARSFVRARILLLSDRGLGSQQVAAALGVHRQRVWRVKKRYLAEHCR